MNLPKVLCLHGFGQNKSIMAKKTKFIRDKLKNNIEFGILFYINTCFIANFIFLLVYISGKFPLPEDHSIVVGFNEFIEKKGLQNQKNSILNIHAIKIY
jgi:hypothetical protein